MEHREDGRDALFIDEVAGHQARYRKLVAFTDSSTKAAAVMLAAALVALVVANLGDGGAFSAFWHTPAFAGFDGIVVGMPLIEIIDEAFMALFFLLVGLEIKYEMTVGDLTDARQAILPIAAACGGVLAPVGIYLAVNGAHVETAMGWGVPTATDIAFALGILALLGNRVPNGVRVFLSTLAVADDIIAILVIAVFYGSVPSLAWLFAVALVFALLILMNRAHIYALAPYLAMGCVLWVCVLMSGVHATIAGVLLAFAIPAGSRVRPGTFAHWSQDTARRAGEMLDPEAPLLGQREYLDAVQSLSRVARQSIPPATRLARRLHPWVYFGVLPLFALTNADVSLGGVSMADLVVDPAFAGVFLGLLVGKPLGIMLVSLLVVRLGIAPLPKGANWAHMLGASVLGGVGFTMAIFVANLAFSDAAAVSAAKLGILSASLLAGIIGFLLLFAQARRVKRRGIAYAGDGEEEVERKQAVGFETAADAETPGDGAGSEGAGPVDAVRR